MVEYQFLVENGKRSHDVVCKAANIVEAAIKYVREIFPNVYGPHRLELLDWDSPNQGAKRTFYL